MELKDYKTLKGNSIYATIEKSSPMPEEAILSASVMFQDLDIPIIYSLPEFCKINKFIGSPNWSVL